MYIYNYTERRKKIILKKYLITRNTSYEKFHDNIDLVNRAKACIYLF